MSAATQAPQVLAVGFAALLAAHQVGDHWAQTPVQALTKGGTGWAARGACARHVLVLSAIKTLALLAAFAVTGLPIRPGWWAAGLGVDAVSHYWADRRTTLRRLAERVGKGELFHLGAPRPDHDDNIQVANGAYLLDQAWHVGWLFISTLIIAWGAR